jgi:LPXTG-motif cell wall-anchored protein
LASLFNQIDISLALAGGALIAGFLARRRRRD